MGKGVGPGLNVPRMLSRGAHSSPELWIESARFSIDLLAGVLDRVDLDGIEVLDVGCGTKLTKVILDEGRPIGRYVGVDVSEEVVSWLQQHVEDPRFEYYHLDARNDLYNPAGTPLDAFGELPVGAQQFDLLCLFSVFTHLAPDDYVAMLRLLRKHVKPDGRLLYSLFIGHPLAGSPALSAALEEALRSDDPEVVARAEGAIGHAMSDDAVADYQEGEPEIPLLESVYSREHALALVEGTGWEIVEVRDPVLPHIQHHLICRPSP